jgi:hypothetical protein
VTTRSKVILAVHRIVLRIAGTWLGGLWARGYQAAARAWAAYLLRGEHDGTAYVRGSLGGEDLLPGLSDVDVAIVVRGDPGARGLSADRVRARWQRLRSAFRLTDLLLDYPLILEREELAEAANYSAFTFGLGEQSAAYQGDRVSPDVVRLLERPGLYTTCGDWRPLTGADDRPPEHARDAQERRIAAWLELCSWWQFAFPVCADPRGPRSSSLCVKLVAEPVRIWLWLAHGERAESRADVLRRGLRRLPGEEQALRIALDLRARLPRSPAPPLVQVLPMLMRMSARIEALIAAEIAGEGVTEVRLARAREGELIAAHGTLPWDRSRWAMRTPQTLPLCDFNGLTRPGLLDESFAALPGDPGDPALLAAATTAQDYGPYPALRSDRLLLFAGTRARTRLRAIKSAATDPVSFALLDRQSHASFPNVRGWSARDVSARALAEHRAWLAMGPASGDPDAAGRELSMLLSAARAALFAESLSEDREPELGVTVTAAARRLVARSADADPAAKDALDAYRQFAIDRTPPDRATVAAARELVLRLPAYAGSRRQTVVPT